MTASGERPARGELLHCVCGGRGQCSACLEDVTLRLHERLVITRRIDETSTADCEAMRAAREEITSVRAALAQERERADVVRRSNAALVEALDAERERYQEADAL